MANEPDFAESLGPLKGQVVVIGVDAPYVYAGTLTAVEPWFLVLEDADVHDLRDAGSTRELYVIETRLHGVRANRRQVYVRRDQVISISPLEDVIEP